MTEQNNNTSQRLTGFRAFIPFYILYDLDLEGHHFRLYGQIEQMESNPDPTVQPYFSYSWMAKELGIGRRHAISIANVLRKKGYIERIKVSKGKWRWSTVKKPIIQESIEEDEDLTSDPADHQQDLGSDPADHHTSDPADHLKIPEVKSLKKDLKDIADSPNTAKVSKKVSLSKNYKDNPRFMAFYDAYPKKVDPHDAYKAFKQVIGDDDKLLALILADIELRKEKHTQWRDKQFIKYPAVYLRKGEYLGEIINQEDEKKAQIDERKRVADERLKAQEEASQKRAAIELANNQSKQSDAVAYRDIAPKATGRPEGLVNLRKTMGL